MTHGLQAFGLVDGHDARGIHFFLASALFLPLSFHAHQARNEEMEFLPAVSAR